MPHPAEPTSRYRLLAFAVLASVALHAAVMIGMPQRGGEPEDLAEVPVYAATLDLPIEAVPAPAPAAAKPAPRRRVRARPRPLPPPVAPEVLAALPLETLSDAGPELLAPPEIIALAQPAAPVKALEPPPFPVDGLPASVSIDYQLTSAFADGRASYQWEREGDSYRIRGEAQAEGFFTLFLEGRIVQETYGTVTAAGLRPERFSEQRPDAAAEGLEFDWPGRQVTFERGGERRTSELTDNTVDWLSMLFQLAHLPPRTESFDLQVFTQRRMYRFRLKVLGVEEIEIPLGRVRALHLRHEDTAKNETVDVWLGIEQHYLPVKLRFPAARNRLTVEQVATRVSESSP